MGIIFGRRQSGNRDEWDDRFGGPLGQTEG